MGQPLDKETIADMEEGIEQAAEMQRNLDKYGTIDVPKGERAQWKIDALEGGVGSLEEVEAHQAEAEVLRRQNLINEAVADGRKLVTVRKISEINDIPGADLIKVASVEGWKVVVKAGEFQPGDPCVYFEIDSYLPMDDERYKFLEKNAINWQNIPGARLKPITLRKQRSEGLALPLDLFPEIAEKEHDMIGRNVGRTYQWVFHVPGSDEVIYESDFEEVRQLNFTGALGIMKWEKIINAQLAGMAKGGFPSFLRKSDQERCQNMGNAIFGYDETHTPIEVDGIPQEAIDSMIAKGELFLRPPLMTLLGVGGPAQYFRVRPPTAKRDTRYEVSLKMDGSSMTVYCRLAALEGELNQLGVCSRNLDLKMEGNDDNAFVKIANEGMLEQLETYCKQVGKSYAIQGELMGPGIQGNREALKANTFFVYNIFDIDAGEFLTPTQRWTVLAELNNLAEEGIGKYFQHVPILHDSATLEELGITDMDSLLAFANGPSLVNNVREGVVFKEIDGPQQFKAISHIYLDQEK